MKNPNIKNRTLLLSSDVAGFTLSFLLAYWLRMKSGYVVSGYVPLEKYISIIVFLNIALVTLFASFSLYKVRRSSSFTEEFLTLTKVIFLMFFILAAATFILKVTMLSRIVILLSLIFSICLISGVRFFFYKWLLKRDEKRCVIFNENETGRRIVKKLTDHPELGYRFEGFVHSLKEINRHHPEVVFVTTEMNTNELSVLSITHPDIEFKIVPSYIELITEPLTLNELQDIPIINLRPGSTQYIYIKIKPAIDKLISCILLILLSPFLALIAASIKLTSRGPILYKQKRFGRHEQPFDFYKFRTMKIDNQTAITNETEYLFKTKNDPRVTSIGKFLRRFCLDELPQLINVIKSDMSLVGPRPHLKEELKDLEPWQKRRFEVLPGMTGLWQISGRHELSFKKSIFLDLYYVKNMSFKLDLEVMLKTVPAILFSKMG